MPGKKQLTLRQKVAATVLATAALGAIAAGPAFAEGSFTSSVTGGLADPGVGFNSRWWTDSQKDATNTTTAFSKCVNTSSRTNAPGVLVTLYRDNGLFPDHNHGRITNACNNTQASWGHGLPKGSFRWRIDYVKVYSGNTTVAVSGYRVDIPSLTTRY